MTRRFAWLKAYFVVPVILLNLLFLGTSRAFSYLPFPYNLVWAFSISDVAVFFGLGLQAFYDVASVSMIAVLFLLVYVGYRDKGRVTAVLTAIAIESATLLPLGIEVYVFDNPEWTIHASYFQQVYNVIPWFSNADLFVSCAAVLATSSFLLLFRRSLGSQPARSDNLK